MINSINFPLPEMYLISKNARSQRKLVNLPPGLNCIDYIRVAEIGRFYNGCQDMREHYTDVYNKVPKPIGLRVPYGKCDRASTVDKNTELLSEPLKFVEIRQPFMQPYQPCKSWNTTTTTSIHLGGRFNKGPHFAYKR